MEAEENMLTFIIPFEKNKSEYRKEDIQPFLSTLNEPVYFINGLYVYAYSSIEGVAISNSQLQRKRAESIIKTIKTMHSGAEISTIIKTDDSWNLFVLEAKDGEFDELTKMKKSDAIHKVNSTPGLVEKIEPILSKERFAKVVMDIQYDIAGKKEEKYAIAQFNKALKIK